MFLPSLRLNRKQLGEPWHLVVPQRQGEIWLPPPRLRGPIRGRLWCYIVQLARTFIPRVEGGSLAQRSGTSAQGNEPPVARIIIYIIVLTIKRSTNNN